MYSISNHFTSLFAFPAAYGDGVEGGHGEWADIVRRGVDGRSHLSGGDEEGLRGRSAVFGRVHLRYIGRSWHGLRVDASATINAPAEITSFERNQRAYSMTEMWTNIECVLSCALVPVTAGLPEDGGVSGVGGVGTGLAASSVSENGFVASWKNGANLHTLSMRVESWAIR